MFESKYFKYVKWSRKKIDKIFQFGIRLAIIIKTGSGALDWSNSTLFRSVIRAYFQKLEKPFYKYTSYLIGYNRSECTACKACEKGCPTNAIFFKTIPVINHNKCILCFLCLRNCPNNALYFKLLPRAKYFQGPKTIRGYIPPDEILKEYSQLNAFSNKMTPKRSSS